MVHWFIGSSSSGWWYTDPWKIWVRQLGLLFLRWWESHNPAMFQTFPNHQPIIFIHFLCQTCHLANPLVTFQHHPRLPGGTCHDAGTTSRLLWRGVVRADAICHYTLSFYGCFNCSSLYILHVYVYSFMRLVIHLFVCIYVFMYLCHVIFQFFQQIYRSVCWCIVISSIEGSPDSIEGSVPRFLLNFPAIEALRRSSSCGRKEFQSLVSIQKVWTNHPRQKLETLLVPQIDCLHFRIFSCLDLGPIWMHCDTSLIWSKTVLRYCGYLVGGAITILKNMSSSMGKMTSHILWEITQPCLKPPTSFPHHH